MSSSRAMAVASISAGTLLGTCNPFSVRRWCSLLMVATVIGASAVVAREDTCTRQPVIHVLQHPGCVPKPIPSFACRGSCFSYVQVSGSKFWQIERSCVCCQEMGEREAIVDIRCPKSRPHHRRIITRAPLACMCRPCTAIDENVIQPQEMAALTSAAVSDENLPDVTVV